jgi:mannosyltransferase
MTVREINLTHLARRRQTQSSMHWLSIMAIVLLGAGCLVINLDARGVWFDEIIYLNLERQSPSAILNALSVTFSDHHPPAYHFLAHAWIQIMGDTDFAIRLLSVLLGILSLALLYQIGKTLGGASLGRVAALLLAVSPLAILFTRLARYYALTTTLGLLSTWLFLQLCQRPSRDRWIAYILACVLLTYTDYLGCSLIIGQGLLALFVNRQVRGWLLRWLISQLAVAVLYLPWLYSFVRQAASASQWSAADLAYSLTGYLLKLIYPLYAFSVGATLFPWEAIAILGGIALLVLAVLGLRSMNRSAGPWGSDLLIVAAFIGIPFALVFLTVSFVTPLVPFVAIPDHMVFAVPFFCLLFAAGWLSLPSETLQLGIGLIVLATYASSYYNYLAGINFHNPVYAVPIGQAVDWVMDNTQPGDVILAEQDTGFGYHYGKRNHIAPYYDTGPESFSAIANQKPLRVWVVTFGRDRTRASDESSGPVPFLQEQGYVPVIHRGYVEQDRIYRQVKQRLLNRPAYRYKLEIQLYAAR